MAYLIIPSTCFVASRHFAVDMSSGSPWNSGRSMSRLIIYTREHTCMWFVTIPQCITMDKHVHVSKYSNTQNSSNLHQDVVVKNFSPRQSWMNGTHCLNQLFMSVGLLWIRSRSASTCSWGADDMSIKSESLSTAHQLWSDLIWYIIKLCSRKRNWNSRSEHVSEV